jgi:hypothetical protein
MAIRVCKHCRNRAAKLKWQDLMRAGKWCGSHSWLVLPPESEPFANQGSKCAKFLGSNCRATKFWKIFEVLTRCPSVYICIFMAVHQNVLGLEQVVDIRSIPRQACARRVCWCGWPAPRERTCEVQLGICDLHGGSTIDVPKKDDTHI